MFKACPVNCDVKTGNPNVDYRLRTRTTSVVDEHRLPIVDDAMEKLPVID